ncbi:MAG: tetratricopeptide repeat protein, partial [Anaerolineae bacterium]|nr:tetratricopeptide repeat protein [Anaerolineae bacterium]
ALLHVQDGKYEEAVQLYQTSVGLIENSNAQAISWNNLGNAHRALKAYEEAEKAFRKADDLVGEKIAIENSTRYGLLDDTSSS